MYCLNFEKDTFYLIFLFLGVQTFASYILIPMDAESQKNHLKAYGITYWIIRQRTKS